MTFGRNGFGTSRRLALGGLSPCAAAVFSAVAILMPAPPASNLDDALFVVICPACPSPGRAAPPKSAGPTHHWSCRSAPQRKVILLPFPTLHLERRSRPVDRATEARPNDIQFSCQRSRRIGPKAD